MKPDDTRIPESLELAKAAGMHVEFGKIDLGERHPNSVELILEGVNGRTLTVVGESIGGSQRIDTMAGAFGRCRESDLL